MLEKTRIHRAMLQLDHGDGFSAKDLAVTTAAASSTIRKTIERAVEQQLLGVRGTRPVAGLGGPEKLFRLLPGGRHRLEKETSGIYAKLLGSPSTQSDVDLPAEALQAGLETLQALRGPIRNRDALLDRLAVASAQLDEAARDQGETGRKAALLQPAVRVAETRAEQLVYCDDSALRALSTALLDQVAKALTLSPLDVLSSFLPALRREAATHTTDSGSADVFVCRVLADLCASNLAGTDTPKLVEQARSLLRGHLAGKSGMGQDLAAPLQEFKNEQLKIEAYLAEGTSSILTGIVDGLNRLKLPNALAALLETVSVPREAISHRLGKDDTIVGYQIGTSLSPDMFEPVWFKAAQRSMN